MLPVILSVKRGTHRADDSMSPSHDQAYQEIRPVILERDNNTCQYCGFHSTKMQEVHHVDDDHSNQDESNLATICVLCHMAFHIGFAGANEMGCIIYTEDHQNITQAQFNNLIRTLWVGELSDDRDKKLMCGALLTRFSKMRVPAKKKYGTSDPTWFGDYLLKLSKENYEKREKAFAGALFLPNKDKYKKEIKFWSENTFRGIPSTTWTSIAKQKVDELVARDVGDSNIDSIMDYLDISNQ
ncbi:HNH endonuclease [Vibrio splendidus]